jgi:hypothetical protein
LCRCTWMILSLVARLTLLLQGLQKTWAGNFRWAWWVSCSSFSGYRSCNQRKKYFCTKLSKLRTSWGSSRWRTLMPWWLQGHGGLQLRRLQSDGRVGISRLASRLSMFAVTGHMSDGAKTMTSKFTLEWHVYLVS